MFVFWNSLFGKLISKLFCVCLPLEKLVNGKHFPVKENFGVVSRKMFFLLAVFVQTSLCLFAIRKLVNGKHFPVKGKFGLIFRKVFSWKIWAENTFRKLRKN